MKINVRKLSGDTSQSRGRGMGTLRYHHCSNLGEKANAKLRNYGQSVASSAAVCAQFVECLLGKSIFVKNY